MLPPPQHILAVLLASPWAPAVWKIHLNFGREKDTLRDDADYSWGASGARLAFTVQVCIQAERYPTKSNGDVVEFLGQRCDQFQVQQDSSFVSMKGQENVRFADQGAWRLSTRQSSTVGDASTVRLIMELQDAVERNDVTVPAQRLYLVANAWRATTELPVAQRRTQAIQAAYQQAQDLVDAQLSHESGDRRLDGTNLLDTAAATLDMAGLVKRRDDCLFALRQAQESLPYKELSTPGNWPGSDESLVIQEGYIAVKKKKGGFFGSDELAVIGRWTATPIVSTVEADDDEYEYYDDEDEEEVVEDYDSEYEDSLQSSEEEE